MNYLKQALGISSFLSVVVALVAVSAVVFGAVAVAAIGSFLILFPLVLLTAPALKRLAKFLEAKVQEYAATKAAEAANQAKAKPAS